MIWASCILGVQLLGTLSRTSQQSFINPPLAPVIPTTLTFSCLAVSIAFKIFFELPEVLMANNTSPP